MPRVKATTICKRCQRPFHRANGNVSAKYCDRVCALRDLNTPEHQRKAGLAGGNVKKIQRGLNVQKTTYIKENGQHQHRIVAQKLIGRQLKRGEIVHHKDGDKHNNDPKNLEVMTQSEHIKLHLHTKKI